MTALQNPVSKEKLDDYIGSLSIHGLTKSITGKKFEFGFWTLILSVGLGLVLFVVSGLLRRYQEYRVYTELKTKNTARNAFPSVTICEKTLLKNAYFAFCGMTLDAFIASGGLCTRNATGLPRKRKRTAQFPGIGVQFVDTPFQITFCMSYGLKNCNDAKFFRLNDKLNDSCVTWNYKGDFHDAYGSLNIKFNFRFPEYTREPPEIFVTIQDHRISEIDISKKLVIDSRYLYDIKIDHTYIRRLPSPFPAKCTADDGNNIFPGQYTRLLCIESYYYVDMYKKCGDIFDYHRQFIPPKIKTENSRNNTNIIKCLMKYSRSKLTDLKMCRLPCELNEYNYMWIFKTKTTGPGKKAGKRKFGNRTNCMFAYDLTLHLKTVDEYIVLEEKQLYTMSQMLCEIGGFVGLIMGMSVISVIEVIAVCVLTVMKKIGR